MCVSSLSSDMNNRFVPSRFTAQWCHYNKRKVWNQWALGCCVLWPFPLCGDNEKLVKLVSTWSHLAFDEPSFPSNSYPGGRSILGMRESNSWSVCSRQTTIATLKPDLRKTYFADRLKLKEVFYFVNPLLIEPHSELKLSQITYIQ